MTPEEEREVARLQRRIDSIRSKTVPRTWRFAYVVEVDAPKGDFDNGFDLAQQMFMDAVSIDSTTCSMFEAEELT